MSFAAALILAAQAAPLASEAAVPAPRILAVRGTATVEIVRAGRSSGKRGAEDVIPQISQNAAGQVLAEFR